MVADVKKIQTYINKLADTAQAARDAVAAMKAIRTLYVAAAPDPTGTPLAGNEAAVSSAIDALDAEVSKAVWTQVIAAKVETHRGEAL